jgi:threonine/homoserine/homoserine lactone efflux protein
LIDLSILVLFIPTFMLVSATPGMCMTLAMTMGMTVGVRRTFWMMWGELAGVGLGSVAAVVGVATIMLHLHFVCFSLPNSERKSLL